MWYILFVSVAIHFGINRSMCTTIKQDVLVKHRCPRRNQTQNLTKSPCPTFLPPPSPPRLGHVTSEKCEQPLYELSPSLVTV